MFSHSSIVSSGYATVQLPDVAAKPSFPSTNPPCCQPPVAVAKTGKLRSPLKSRNRQKDFLLASVTERLQQLKPEAGRKQASRGRKTESEWLVSTLKAPSSSSFQMFPMDSLPDGYVMYIQQIFQKL